MKSVGQPDIHINREAARANRLDGFLAHRYRVIPERSPEPVVEPHTVLPKCRLVIVHDTAERNGILDEGSVVSTFGAAFPIGEEGEPAARNPASLLGY